MKKTQSIAGAAALALSFGMASAQNAMDRPSLPNNAVPATPHISVQGPAAQLPPINPPFPAVPAGNHYVCYPATVAGEFVPFSVTLRDQFGQGTARVTGITRLCNPVEKRVEFKTTDGKADRRVYPIVNDKLHITCYTIVYSGSQPQRVTTNDQFGPKRVSLQPAKELCLPAGKKR